MTSSFQGIFQLKYLYAEHVFAWEAEQVRFLTALVQFQKFVLIVFLLSEAELLHHLRRRCESCSPAVSHALLVFIAPATDALHVLISLQSLFPASSPNSKRRRVRCN